jgi:chromosome segregation ATPase
MSDLIERLRDVEYRFTNAICDDLRKEAADEIERLRRERDAYKDAATARDRNEDALRRELAKTQDQASSLLATNYDLRKERDRLIDDIAYTLVLLEKHGISFEITNDWIKVFRSTP